MNTSFNEFISYVLSFYGETGIYPENKRTKEQVSYATLMYLDSLTDTRTWGEGDSLDRARVRDLMNNYYGVA